MLECVFSKNLCIFSAVFSVLWSFRTAHFRVSVNIDAG